jgi:hypothetical protein
MGRRSVMRFWGMHAIAQKEHLYKNRGVEFPWRAGAAILLFRSRQVPDSQALEVPRLLTVFVTEVVRAEASGYKQVER